MKQYEIFKEELRGNSFEKNLWFIIGYMVSVCCQIVNDITSKLNWRLI